jgi:hypothetical protein
MSTSGAFWSAAPGVFWRQSSDSHRLRSGKREFKMKDMVADLHKFDFMADSNQRIG